MAISDKLLFKEALSATMFARTTQEAMWTLDDTKDVNISFSSESEEKTDARNAVIAKYYYAKKAQVTGNTSYFTLSLVAAQFGSEKVEGTATEKILMPKKETISIGFSEGTTANTTVKLAKVPAGMPGSEIPFIYIIDNKKAMVKSYAVGTTASADKFSIDAKKQTITLPTDAENIKGEYSVQVFYKYETETAVRVDNNSNDIPKQGELWIECLFADICDQNIEYHGWIIMNSAQLSPDTEIPLNKTGDYPFTIDSLSDYCSDKGQLLSVLVDEG